MLRNTYLEKRLRVALALPILRRRTGQSTTPDAAVIAPATPRAPLRPYV
jgi:hypothetical protein